MTPRVTRGLYAISTETTDTAALLGWAKAVLDGGAVWLQYRDKSDDATRRLVQASALARECRSRGAVFIVNDDVALAKASDADGVHVGGTDATPADARAALGPDRLIGVSCYDDIGRAAAAAAHGIAGYLAFGAFFASATKPQAVRATPDLLAGAAGFGLPRVAIGGITPENGRVLIEAGADLLAVVGGLAGPPDAAFAAARRYASLFDTAGPTSP
jgi:thiamine-phosphate pyrophosphorylase